MERANLISSRRANTVIGVGSTNQDFYSPRKDRWKTVGHVLPHSYPSAYHHHRENRYNSPYKRWRHTSTLSNIPSADSSFSSDSDCSSFSDKNSSFYSVDTPSSSISLGETDSSFFSYPSPSKRDSFDGSGHFLKQNRSVRRSPSALHSPIVSEISPTAVSGSYGFSPRATSTPVTSPNVHSYTHAAKNSSRIDASASMSKTSRRQLHFRTEEEEAVFYLVTKYLTIDNERREIDM